MFRKSLSVALGLFLIIMGIRKLLGDMPIFELIEIYTGLSFADPYGRIITVAFEIFAGSLLIAGKRFEGGALAMLILVIALLFHLSVLGIHMPVSLAENAQTSPLLFILALTAFAIATLITIEEYLDTHQGFMMIIAE